MTALVRILVLCSLLWAAMPLRAADEETYETIGEQAAQALWWGDWEELERLHAGYSQPGQFVANGRSKVSAFRAGADRVLKGKKQDPDAYFAELDALTLQWATQHPGSSLAQVLHASALLSHAWSYRGSGFSNTVPPQAWEDFGAYVQRAAAHMSAHADAMLASGSGYVEAIEIGRAAGWPVDRLLAISRTGLDKHPDDEGIAMAMLNSLLPKWRGSAVQVDRYIEEVVERTRTQRGMEFYARMYAWAAEWQFEHELFIASGAQWPKMKQGYDDMLRRYPSPGNLNRYAYFACLAQDKPTAFEVIEKIGSKPELDSWGSNGARSYETCKRWASRQ